MIRKIRLLVTLVLSIQLSACAVMSKRECQDGHWERIGHKVGMSGERDRVTEFNKRAEICAKYDSIVDQEAFNRGHEAGIEQYCDIPSAVDLGSRGVSTKKSIDNCPEYDYPGFASAYQAGYKLHELKRRVQQAQLEVDRLQNDAYRYQRERSQLRHDVRSGELSDQQIRYAQRRSNQLRRDIRSIQDGVYYHRDRVEKLQRAADDYARLLDVEYGDGRPEY